MASSVASFSSFETVSTTSDISHPSKMIYTDKVKKHNTIEAEGLLSFFNKMSETPNGKKFLNNRELKKVKSFVMRQGFDINLRLRILLLQLINMCFEGTDCELRVFGGFCRELIRETLKKGSGYFRSDIDIGFTNVVLARSLMKEKVVRLFQTLNLDFSLKEYTKEVLSLNFKFGIGEDTYTVPVDFVFIPNCNSVCDFDVNNLRLYLEAFNVYSYITMLESSYAKNCTALSATGDVLNFSSLRGMINQMFNSFHVPFGMCSADMTSICIDAIESGIATLIYTSDGHIAQMPSITDIDVNKLIIKWHLIRGPKLVKRGFELGGRYPKCVKHTDEVCPICQDGDDTKYVVLSCCNKVVHHECLNDYLFSKRGSKIDAFKCFCCSQTSSLVMSDIYDTLNLVTSSEEVQTILDAFVDMRATRSTTSSEDAILSEQRRRVVQIRRRTRPGMDY
jgi:hypothetical protein